jgi:hypothetical protein
MVMRPIPPKTDYYFLVPRVMDGGTRAGTAVATKALGSDNERLFASVDELAFSPVITGTNRVSPKGNPAGRRA